MGADGGLPGTASQFNVLSSSDVPPLPQYLSLEPISLDDQKFLRSGELRRALGIPLASACEDHMFRASSFKPPAPVATEDVRLFKENVLNASFKAGERAKLFRSSIYKLERYTEAVGSKKRPRSDPSSMEKPGGSILLKSGGYLSRQLPNQSTERLEDKAKCGAMNKRFRSTAAELKVDSKFSSISRDQMNSAVDISPIKSVGEASAPPEERIPRLSAVGEGWDKNMKRKRSIGTVANRSTDNDMKTVRTKLNSNVKLVTCDAFTISRLGSRSNAKHDTASGNPGTVAKGKISRAPRTGFLMAVNSSDGQLSESCEGWEHPSSANKIISLGLTQSKHRTANSSNMLGPRWAGQRQQKSSRSRRTNVVSPVTNHEGQNISLNSGPPEITTRSPLNGDAESFDNADVCNIDSAPYTKSSVENAPSFGRLLEIEGKVGFEHGLQEKGKDNCDLSLQGKGKVGTFIVPTKKKKNLLNENGIDGTPRQVRTVKGLSLSGMPEPEAKLENVITIKRFQNTRHGHEKIRGKSGRPPSRKMSDGRVTRYLESNDDHEELLAAAASARKARYLFCSGRFWKRMESVFGSLSSQDVSHLKQQLNLADDLEDSQYLVSCAENNFLGHFMRKERADVPSGRKGSDSNQVVDRNELMPFVLSGERSLDNATSLYQRVLCSLIEEDENEGFYSGFDGASVSFQCASDDSHCGSCNYADTETRDRDRFDSEAESIVDFQMPKRYSGDRLSCNKSVTSNTTWNTSMSDSLYSSGRWLGDDGLTYSDAEFIGGSYQNDVGGSQGGTNSRVSFDDCQYELMCVDDKLVMELQSIGLYPDTMPDLVEGEVINQDITELKEGLYDQIGKKKLKLVKIDSAVDDDSQKEKRFLERVAMEQLVQMAYKRRMAYRRNNASKPILRKVSKQVASGFVNRTLERYDSFEATGRSCFSEPAFQNALFAAPQGTDAGTNIVTNAYIGNGAPKRLNTSKADSVSLSMPDSCIDDFSGGWINSAQGPCHASDKCFPKLESASHKLKKRELLIEDVGGVPFNGAKTHGRSVISKKTEGRSRESNTDKSKISLITNAVRENPSVGGYTSDEKLRVKTELKVSDNHLPSSSIPQQTDIWVPSSCNDLKDGSVNVEAVDFDDIAQNDTIALAPDDLNDDWFKDLPDGDDFTGCLDIPMDDLSMVL